MECFTTYISATHLNCKKWQLDSFIETFKNACLISLISITLYEQILINMLINLVSKLVPVSKHWFKEGASFADEA